MAILESHDDRREFPRLASGVRVFFRGSAVRKADREYLEGVAENVSLGGMFIATQTPLREGSVAWLEFHVPGEEVGRPVRARGIVCWRRRWLQPRGMGIRFVEIENLGQRRLESWMASVLAPEAGVALNSKVFSGSWTGGPDTGQDAGVSEFLALTTDG